MIDKRYFICEICGEVFTPASNLRKHIVTTMGKTINWPQIVIIVAPVSIGKTHDGAHWWSNKQVFQVCLDVVSTFQYEHIVHLGFSLVLSFTFGFSPLWKNLMYLQDCGFSEMFVIISSISALIIPLPA